jgi:hypothetical protein
MNHLNYIGKDCRNLIWKKLSDSEKFPLLFVNKQYKEEIKKLFKCVMHDTCFSMNENICKSGNGSCLASILPDLIKKDYFELVKLYYSIFLNETVLFYILYHSSKYDQREIFKYFFLLNGNKCLNHLIIGQIIEKESLELIKFIIINNYPVLNEINNHIEYGKTVSNNFKNSLIILFKNEKIKINVNTLEKLLLITLALFLLKFLIEFCLDI